MRKISIIGAAGTLGASCALTISLENYADELCLIDVNETLLDNHVMDFENAFPDKNIYRGTYKDLEGSSIVVITAGVPNRNDETSRDAYLKDNIRIFEQIGSNITNYSPNAIILTVSNPVDLLNYYLYKRFSFKRHQLIGYTLNDSYRFGWAINKVLGEKNNVYSPVIGEHGETQVPIFSQVKINNKDVELTAEQKKRIHEEINSWFVTFNRLYVPRTTGWTTSVGVTRVIRALTKEEGGFIIGSTVLEGEFANEGLSIGVPLMVNKNGIQKVIQWEMLEEERQAFHSSAQKIKNMIEENATLFCVKQKS